MDWLDGLPHSGHSQARSDSSEFKKMESSLSTYLSMASAVLPFTSALVFAFVILILIGMTRKVMRRRATNTAKTAQSPENDEHSSRENNAQHFHGGGWKTPYGYLVHCVGLVRIACATRQRAGLRAFG
jgi:hypothetical protein